MEKITREELMKKLSLTETELEKRVKLTEEELEKISAAGYGLSGKETFNPCCFGWQLVAAGIMDKDMLDNCPPYAKC